MFSLMGQQWTCCLVSLLSIKPLMWHDLFNKKLAIGMSWHVPFIHALEGLSFMEESYFIICENIGIRIIGLY